MPTDDDVGFEEETLTKAETRPFTHWAGAVTEVTSPFWLKKVKRYQPTRLTNRPPESLIESHVRY